MENLNFPPVEFSRAYRSPSDDSVFQEFAIVLRNMNHFEIIPTEKWLSLMQEKATLRQQQNLREADRLQHLSVELGESGQIDKAMVYITQALYRCPQDNTLAKAILCQKGELLRRQQRMQDAIRHLEHCLRIEGDRFAFGTYLCLLRCYKAMGNALKVRTTLSRCAIFFNRWKTEFQRYDSQLKNNPDPHMEEMKKEFDLHANCIPQEVSNDKNFRNEPAVQDNYEEEIEFEPFNGYSSDRTIAGASSAVEFQTSGLVANVSIPEGSILLIERPFVSHLEFSKVQCYTCHVVHPHLIPCFNCQSVFYCSFQCQKTDAVYHQFECRGYQILFFPLVNGNLEIRMLIRTLNALKQVLAVKSAASYRNPHTADQLYKLLLQGKDSFAELFSALLVNMDYSQFRAEDFDALMIKTEKLLSYIKFEGSIKSTFFAELKYIDNYQFDIFIGGLLLHFCTLTMTKVNRLSFEVPATQEFVARVQDYVRPNTSYKDEPLKKTILDTLERYGKEVQSPITRRTIDSNMLRQGVLRHLDMLQNDYEDKRGADPPKEDQCHQVWSRSNVKQLWQWCLDSVELGGPESSAFCRDDVVSQALRRFCDSYYEQFTEIPMCTKNRTFPNTMRAFYTTSMKLKHSCEPNLFFAMISNGLFVARARCNISKGEQLTLNHGPHYKEANREERTAYLRKIYINCTCSQCIVTEDHWQCSQRVKCANCIFKVGDGMGCKNCMEYKEPQWEVQILIQQMQDIESHLSKNNVPQLMPLSALGRSASGVQTATASGKRKMELLIFFEHIWTLMFINELNVPLYNNLKEQLSCFADEVLRDTIDGVWSLLQRCKRVIDALFPHMSVQVANEYELVVRRAVKYMHPAKFLGVDTCQVHRAIDLARSMIKQAFVILESHFLHDDESYHKLLVVERLLSMFEENIRVSSAKDEGELFLTLVGANRKKEPEHHRKSTQKAKNVKVTKQTNDSQVVVDLQHLSQDKKLSFLKDVSLPEISSIEDSGTSDEVNGDSANSSLIIDADGEQQQQQQQQEDGPESPASDSKKKADKNVKRKETGAIPKPSRTTKHHRKV